MFNGFSKHFYLALLVMLGLLWSAPAFAGTLLGLVDAMPSPASPNIGGWACVQGQATSITVAVYVGPTTGPAIGIGAYQASLASEAGVAAACKSTGTNYRFWVSLPNSVFQKYEGQTFYVYAVQGSQMQTLQSSSPLIIPSPNMLGTLDQVTTDLTCVAEGWAKDPLAPQPVWVDFYIDAPYGQGGTWVGGETASLIRSDLPYADKNHGFIYAFPSSSKIWDGRPHQLYAYGDALAGNVTTKLLNNSPMTIMCPVNVKSFGAVGDGVWDDSLPIQQALDSLPAGGSAFFPSGTYLLASGHGSLGTYPDNTPIMNALTINHPAITLFGEGSKSVLKLGAHAKLRVLAVAQASAGVTIRNLTIDGNKANRTGSSWPGGDIVDAMVYGWLAQQLTIQNVESRNGLEDGFGCWQCATETISGSNSHDNGNNLAGATGISFSGTNGTFTGNTIANNSSAGIWTAFGTSTIFIQGNQITSNVGAALAIGGQGGTDQGYTVSENTMTGNGASGFAAVQIAGATNGFVSNNQIANNRAAIEGADGSWVINSNQCTRNGTMVGSTLVQARGEQCGLLTTAK